MIDKLAILRELQDIVGDAWARGDEATLTNYAWNGGVGAIPGPKFIKHWPLAAVLPQTAEEIAAIIKLCKARGIHYRAFSTGNGAMHLALTPNSVMIDLCRMNRILKIDAANQMVVLESGVTAGRLQAEAMRHGLTCHIVGAGPSHSPVASATSFLGIGVTGSSTGQNARNILALEWVSPDGEIVRIGSFGDDDWFSEEGPGPGFRGIIRGFMGACGSLGVFTRIGYKLYPWAGPARPVLTGSHPQIGMQIPSTMRLFMPVWDNLENMRDALFRLNRASVAFAMLRMPPAHIGWLLTSTNAEYARRKTTGELPDYTDMNSGFAWQIVTMGHSDAQAAFQENLVRHVVAETGGRFFEVGEREREIMFRNIVASTYVARVFRGAGAGGTSFGICDSVALLPGVIRTGEKIAEQHRKPGGMYAADCLEGNWAWPTEGRQIWSENILAAQPGTASGIAEALVGFIKHLYLIEKDPSLGVPAFVAGPLIDLYGPRMQGVNHWMRRIKLRLDPTWTADASYYVPQKMPAPARAWPVLQKILFTRPGEKLLRGALTGAARKSL